MNPFRYSGPVPSSEVINRRAELDILLTTAESANNSRLLAPREFGKTSLLNKLLGEAGKAGWATVYVDFFGVLSLADVAERVEAAYRSQLSGDVAAWFETFRRGLSAVRLGGGPVPASVEVDLRPGERPLIERLNAPMKILEKRGLRTLVVFDEFQDVLEARQDADEVIRSAIQHHGEAASYVFAGSELGVMRELFASRRRAFYRQAARIELEPLDESDLGEYVIDRFKAGGKRIGAEALAAMLNRCEGHPRSAMLLAHELWARSFPGEEASLRLYYEAEESALEKAGADLRATWRGMNRSDRELLTKLAHGQGPYARAPGETAKQGGTVKAAITRLEDAGEIAAAAKGGYRIVDPFFAELVRRDWTP